jgi:hypothetical protein
MQCQLLVVLRLLIIVGRLLIIIIIENISWANAKSSQLGRSQRGVGIGDGREDRDIEVLLE